MTPYEEIIQAIVAKQIEVLGKSIALSRARHIMGLEMTDEGKVAKISGDQKQILANLVSEYTDILGHAAIMFSKDAIFPIIKQHPDLVLPQSLN